MLPPPKSAPILIVGALFLFCVAVWSIALAPASDAVKKIDARVFGSPTYESRTRMDVLLAEHIGGPELAKRSKTSGCAVRGPFPDRACTPGSVFESATTSVICVSGYTKKVRSVSDKLRRQIYSSYDIAYPQPTGSYELDHLIPLALGGDNSTANLFPEAAEPAPGFKEKDVVEVYLYEEVCAGRLPLAAAQRQIAADWLSVYKALDPAVAARIKQQYKSWSN